jgi:hypothetical protein
MTHVGDPAASRESPREAAATEVTAHLKRLAGLSSGELRKEWQRIYRGAALPRLSRDLLTRGIAYKIQEQAYGGLSQATRRRLATLARTLEKAGAGAFDAVPSLKPGATLVRDWHGETHRVEVLADDGFDYRGRRYRSLSKIAHLITGAHWSGPRFFGLAQRPGSSQEEATDE